MTDLNQLLLQFNYNQNFNYDDFFVSKSNFFAFQLIKKWPRWEKNILNIHGEKFCGKTHLANIFYNKNKGIKIYENQINNEIFKKLKLYENIIIDGFKNETDEKLLYSLFNLVDSDNKFLLINSITPINEIEFNLKDLRSRSKNCLFAKIDNPDDELMFAIILKNFSDRQIKIDKKLIEFIIKRIDRSYGKIGEFIYKIDELSLKKKKPIDFKIIKEILK
jgi:chromosomal replication initiation ATPase DnaA|tara:strand:+ start:329 stop:988 length:660 start_codon:yes stop_codon:yes gene_type:complete